MRRLLLIILTLALFPLGALASEEIRILEEISEASRNRQPGLQTYRVEVVTDKVSEMIEQMTRSIPQNMPRPEVPKIIKYWSRQSFESVIAAEGEQTFGYMQEMVDRFSDELAVDLRSFFLSPSRMGQRAALLEKANLSRTLLDLGKRKLVSVSVEFQAPTDLEGAFYGNGLALPQTGVTKLRFDIDSDKKRISRLDIHTRNRAVRTVEVRYSDLASNPFPVELRVTTPDGSIDDHFTIDFTEVEGLTLPARQTRILKHGATPVETIRVELRNYQLNSPLPATVLHQLQRP